MSGHQFVYFADPMCSWCYGFAPVIAALAERFEGRLGLQLVMGGLRAGHAAPMRDGFRPLDDLLEPLEPWWAAGAPATRAS